MKRVMAFLLVVLLLTPIAGNAAAQSWDQYELMGFTYSVPRGWMLKMPNDTPGHEYYATEMDDVQGGVLRIRIQDMSNIVGGLSQENQYGFLESTFEDLLANERIVEAAQRVMVNGNPAVTGSFEMVSEKAVFSVALLLMDRHLIALMAALPKESQEAQDSLVEQVALSIYPNDTAKEAENPADTAEAMEAILVAVLYSDPESTAAYEGLKQSVEEYVGKRDAAVGVPSDTPPDKVAVWNILKAMAVYGESEQVFEDIITFDDGAQMAVFVGKSPEANRYESYVLFQFDGRNPYLEGVRIIRCGYIIQEAIVAVNGYSKVFCIGDSGRDPVTIVFDSDEGGPIEASVFPESYLSPSPSDVDQSLIIPTKNFINICIGDALQQAVLEAQKP